LLRSLQKETGGFTEFVPLSFVPDEAPMFKRSLIRELRGGPPADQVARVHALARLMLGATFRNVQVSWVKEGMERSIELLACGANDLGGTLINESISTSAGSKHGQRQSPGALRRAIRAAGRIPAQRDTRYTTLRTFASDGTEDPRDPLDGVSADDPALGSYRQLTQDRRFRFVRPDAQ
jgi:2-iminoacetate synthase ThiH